MFFNLFKKSLEKTKEDSLKPDKIIAKLSYCIIEGSKSPIVDVEIEEYNDKCIDALCDILDVLSQDGAFIETMGIVKDGMIADGQEEYLIKIFTHIGQKNKFRSSKTNNSNEPCIKPSDVLR